MVPLPVTGAALLLRFSVNSKFAVLPSAATVMVESEMTLPSFLSISWIAWSSTTVTAIVS